MNIIDKLRAERVKRSSVDLDLYIRKKNVERVAPFLPKMTYICSYHYDH